jgi:hypothetical protein
VKVILIFEQVHSQWIINLNWLTLEERSSFSFKEKKGKRR